MIFSKISSNVGGSRQKQKNTAGLPSYKPRLALTGSSSASHLVISILLHLEHPSSEHYPRPSPRPPVIASLRQDTTRRKGHTVFTLIKPHNINTSSVIAITCILQAKLKTTCSPFYLHPCVSSSSFLAATPRPVITRAGHPAPMPRHHNTPRRKVFVIKHKIQTLLPLPLHRYESLSRDYHQSVPGHVLRHES